MLPAVRGQGGDGAVPLGPWAGSGGGSRGLWLPVFLHIYNEKAQRAALVLQESILLQERPGCSSPRSPPPREPAPERLSLGSRCCLLPTIVLLASTLSRTVQQHGVAGDSSGAGELANPDSLAPLADGGNKQERPLGGKPGFILTRGSPLGTVSQPTSSWPILPHPAHSP